MKMATAHVVPLSDPALAVLEQARGHWMMAPSLSFRRPCGEAGRCPA